MPFVPVPDVAAVALRATLYGKPIQTDFNFLHDGPITQAALDELVDDVLQKWSIGTAALLPNVYTLFSAYAYDAEFQEGLAATANLAVPGSGTRPGLPMPANVSLFINGRIPNRKRGNSGGIFWPCFVEDDITSNSAVSSIIQDILNFLNGWIGLGVVSADWKLVAVSKFLNNLPRTVGLVRDITDWVVNDSVVDSMRRRLPKRSS